jgi:hypothetical protein
VVSVDSFVLLLYDGTYVGTALMRYTPKIKTLYWYCVAHKSHVGSVWYARSLQYSLLDSVAFHFKSFPLSHKEVPDCPIGYLVE